MPKHKHQYVVVNIKRAKIRGYVMVTYRCENYNSLCPKRVVIRKETEK